MFSNYFNINMQVVFVSSWLKLKMYSFYFQTTSRLISMSSFNLEYGVQSTHINMFLKKHDQTSLTDFPGCIVWEAKISTDPSIF